jgi:hypothetical protein
MVLHDCNWRYGVTWLFVFKSSFIHFTHQKVTQALCSLSVAVSSCVTNHVCWLQSPYTGTTVNRDTVVPQRTAKQARSVRRIQFMVLKTQIRFLFSRLLLCRCGKIFGMFSFLIHFIERMGGGGGRNADEMSKSLTNKMAASSWRRLIHTKYNYFSQSRQFFIIKIH